MSSSPTKQKVPNVNKSSPSKPTTVVATRKNEDPVTKEKLASGGKVSTDVESLRFTEEDIARATNTRSEISENVVPVHLSSPVKKKSLEITGEQKLLDDQRKVYVAVPRERIPRSAPPLDVRPLVLATHLVPSIPMGLFEVLRDAVEEATKLPVSWIYESRTERPVSKEIADLAILPAYSEWEEGDFLPITFVFAHRLNDTSSGNIYVDVIVASDRAPHVKDIMDLRGHRCALPDRGQKRGAATLLLGDLRVRGESPAFFGTTLDSGSQISALQMVAGGQAEVGVIESPVLICNKNKIPGVDSLLNLGSLGPLPPYAFYVKKSFPAELREKISSFLLNLKNDEDLTERFSQYGVTGFTNNSLDAYIIDDDAKKIVTSVRYY